VTARNAMRRRPVFWLSLGTPPRPAGWALLLFASCNLLGQERPDMRAIIERLDRLEEQNRQLMAEIRSLREQLAAAPAAPAPPQAQAPIEPPSTLEERTAVNERRIEELDQSKAGVENRLPVTLNGTVLFNAFLNGRASGDPSNPQMYPTTAGRTPGPPVDGATLRQTVLGLRYQGPEVLGGAKVSGTLFLDLFAGTGTSLNQLLRLRVATLDLAWKNTTLSFGQDKPIIAPREPDSLAQVGVSPLTGAGNLWLWEPQVRLEQRFALGENSGLRAQFGVFQTSESGVGVSSEYTGSLARARSGYEGRFEWWMERSGRRFEIAPGFHYSDTHLIGQSVPSRIFSIDWLLRPERRFDFSGQFFHGENAGVIGGLRQSVTIVNDYSARAVHAQGGWAQWTLRATPRLTFHLFGGLEDDRNSDLGPKTISANRVFGGNIMYRLGPNVLASFEASQVRTTYIDLGLRLNPHYDLALAYLF
jgi:hypothetical protein